MRYFEALARHGHFGRAAADCAVSQPALSMQIKELEESLGVALLERSTRGVRLTAFGEEALERVHSILKAIEELTGRARAATGILSGQFRIGMIPTIAPYLLPGFARELAEAYPAVEIALREAMTSKLIAELNEGRLDAAVVALPVSEASLTEVPLFHEAFLLVRPAAEASVPVPTRDELADMRLLLLEEGHCFRDQALTFCRLHGQGRRDTLDANALSTLVQMVGAGMGVTLIPEMALSLETRSAAVAVSRFTPPEPMRSVGMIWRKSSPLAGQLRQLADIVARAAAKLGQTEAP